jgi:GT2 family glycosyltransferase
MEPKASILWVNYNSSSFIDLVLESLQAVKDLDYPNYELIIVDNGSVDDSFNTIKEFINKSNIKSRLIRLDKNLGFTGGNNVAYAARDPNSKYIVLLNNDAVPKKDSLNQFVEILENDPYLGAAQGIILNYDEKSVDSAGEFISELLTTHTLFGGESLNLLKEPIPTTFANAAYSIFKVEAIEKISGGKKQIFDDLFACFDDHLLGMKIWNAGYKIKVFPIVTAKHNRGSSFKKVIPLQLYLIFRNVLMTNELSNSRYKFFIRLIFLRELFVWFIARILGLINNPEYRKLPALLSKGFTEGIKMGIKKKLSGEKIDIYKAPILKVGFSEAMLKIINPKLFDARMKTKLNRVTN